MKKLTYLFALLFMFAAMVSCNKDMTDDSELAELKKAKLEVSAVNVPSEPVSYGLDGLPTGADGIIPQIIPGTNNGGNRFCADVVTAFTTTTPPFTPHFVDCGNKLDYGDFDLDGDYEFNGEFPAWLDVSVTDGKFVSFTVNNSGENCYKVGAVIVKGSNAANVYFYPNGTLSDGGLASPINASGNLAGLSNLTFCFVECEIQTDLVVGFKSYMNGGTNWVTTGAFITSYPLTLNASYKLYLDYYGGEQDAIEVGNITITDLYPTDGYWEITVDNYIMPTMHFTQPFLYVGSTAGFTTDFSNYPYPLSKDPIVQTDTWRYILNYQLP